MPFEAGSYAKTAAAEWDFGGVDYMNHGSYGACPRAVQDFIKAQHNALLQNPMEYFATETPKRMTENRLFWAEFIKADPEGVAHVECATQGVNTVLTSLALRGYFKKGDEILITSHGYNACNNAVREIAGFYGIKVVVADIPFPVERPEQVTEAVLAAATPKACFALIDHIASETGLIFPIREIVARLKERGIETLVDGAHAPAQVPLDLTGLGAAFYTGNGHKWLCAAPGCAFLYVREDFRDKIRPLSTSHGANDPNPEISAYQKTFAWTGTRDMTACFTPKVAFETLSRFHPEGLWGLVEGNRRLVRYGYRLLLDMLNVKPYAPDVMIGTMTTVLLPAGKGADALRKRLREHNFMAQVGERSPQFGKGRFLRLSAQVYNMPEQYERLTDVLERCLKEES